LHYAVTKESALNLISLYALLNVDVNAQDNKKDSPLFLAIDYFNEQKAQAVMSDYLMPEMNGIELLKKIRHGNPNAALMILTGYADKEGAIRAINEVGIYYYLEKPWDNDQILLALRNAIERFDIIEQLEKVNQELERKVRERTRQLEEAMMQVKEMAMTDPLTQLPNRRHFFDCMEQEISRLDRNPQPVSMLMLDIDYFKQVNDRFGHQQGDEALVQFASILKNRKRAYDQCARIGGEEFAILLPNTNHKGALRIAKDIRNSVASSNFMPGGDRPLLITTSIGLCSFSGPPYPEVSMFYKYADNALYACKSGGRNSIYSFDPATGQIAPVLDLKSPE
jgi:diguanylate cyclase (GGDEF)-like protein